MDEVFFAKYFNEDKINPESYIFAASENIESLHSYCRSKKPGVEIFEIGEYYEKSKSFYLPNERIIISSIKLV